jgi:hypothetical protein
MMFPCQRQEAFFGGVPHTIWYDRLFQAVGGQVKEGAARISLPGGAAKRGEVKPQRARNDEED